MVPAHKGKFEETIRNNEAKRDSLEAELSKKPYLLDILNNMASNHSIIKVESTEELVGDPMEIKLFEFGKFSLNQSNSDPEVIFSYESDRKQEGVVVRRF